MFDRMREWDNSKDLQKEYPKVGDYISHVTKLQNQKYKKLRMHSEEPTPAFVSKEDPSEA